MEPNTYDLETVDLPAPEEMSNVVSLIPKLRESAGAEAIKEAWLSASRSDRLAFVRWLEARGRRR